MDYFPLGLAEGRAFCNRAQEREKLRQNIALNRSTLIISPRRYGKSSLALYVLEAMDIPYVRVDLFVTLDESSVARAIIMAVNTLLNSIISKPIQLIAMVKDIIKALTEKWSIGTDGINVTLSRGEHVEDALAIKGALLILEKVLAKKKKKAVFFIDEFQEISATENCKAIEGAIRNVAEMSQYLSFIFSGSNRHVLANMFDERSRPLYMLCEKMTLGRISAQDYQVFIDKIANKHWGGALSETFYQLLFTLTELHPYYVNLLCGRLYSDIKLAATPQNLANIWNNYLIEEKTKTAVELGKLSFIQKKVMILIAQGQQDNLTSKVIINKLVTTSAAMVKAINVLINKDYIFDLGQGNYRITDPIISASIRQFFSVDLLAPTSVVEST